MSLVHNMNVYDPQNAKTAKVDPMRLLGVVEPVRLVGTSFSGTTRDPNFWTDSSNGTGAGITQANQTILACGTDAAGYAVSTSVRTCWYMAGASNFFRAVVQLPVAGLANHRSRWGAFTTATRVPQNGFFFETEGTTLYLNYCNANSTDPPVANRVASASWDVPFTLDTYAHTYEIVWTNSRVYFYVDDILRHTIIAYVNPLCATYNLPITLQNISITSTTNFTVNVRVASIYRFGGSTSEPTYKHITTATTTVCKYGAGKLHHLVANNPTNNSITIYDNTAASGTVIAIINPGASATPFLLDYDVVFHTGLTIVTAGTPDLTIVYE